jgi:hypothetical protein
MTPGIHFRRKVNLPVIREAVPRPPPKTSDPIAASYERSWRASR